MSDNPQALADAKLFVRKALSHFGQTLDDATIARQAEKIVRAFAPVWKHSRDRTAKSRRQPEG